MTQYTLTMNESQAEVVRDALEAYARLHMGQFDAVITNAFMRRYANPDYPDFSHETMDDIHRQLKRTIFPELNPNAYYGVGAKEFPEMTTAWDLMQVVRHRLSWNRLAREGKEKPDFYGVNYNNPMQFGDEPLASIESTEDDT